MCTLSTCVCLCIKDVHVCIQDVHLYPWEHLYVWIQDVYLYKSMCTPVCISKIYLCVSKCTLVCVFINDIYMCACVFVYKIILFKLTWVNILPELFWSNVVSEFNNFAQVRNVAHGPFVSSPTYLSIRFYVKYLVFKHSSFILILVLFLYKSYMKFVVVNAWEQM